MVKVNGLEYKIYSMDTNTSIKQRISRDFNSFSKYLYIFGEENKDNPPLKQYKEIKAIDIFTGIILKKINDADFQNLYNELKDILIKKVDSINIITDVLHVWIAYNRKFDDMINQLTKSGMDIESVMLEYNIRIEKTLKSLPETLITNEILSYKPDILEIIKKRKNIADKIESSLTENRNIVEKFIDSAVIYEKLKPQIPEFVKPNTEYASYNIYLNVKKEISLMEIFNMVEVNDNVPFAFHWNFYKVKKDCIPLREWIDGYPLLKTYIMMFIWQRKKDKGDDLEKENVSDYTRAIIEKKGDEYILNIEINVNKQNVDINEYYKRALSVFNDKITINRIEDVNIKSTFYVPFYSPEKIFDKYVLSDLILNNDIFSHFLIIDEHLRMTKVRSELIVKYKQENGKLSTVNIIQKIREPSDEISSFDVSQYPYGSVYLVVRVTRAESTQVVVDFMNILSRLLSLYIKKYPEVVREYQKYITFPLEAVKEKEKDVIDESRKILKYYAPQLFANPHGQRIKFICNNKPRIISEEKAKTMEQDTYMLFPKDNNFVNPVYLSCEMHDTHKYPGLKQNPFPSSSQVPYLPCCFNENQNKAGTLYKKYYYGTDEDVEDKTKKGGKSIIKTKKFVNIKQPGVLPKGVSDLFNILDPLNNYYRTGVTESPSSFLECIMDAMNIGAFEYDITEEERIKEVIEERKRISKIETGVYKQELFDIPINMIKSILRNTNEYLDPLKFCGFFENIYGCNIRIFKRDAFEEEGELAVPRFSQFYSRYQHTSKLPFVFIYVHEGAITTKKPEFPRCELIYTNIKDDKNRIRGVYAFDSGENISIGINNVFDRLTSSYIISNEGRRQKNIINFDILGNENISIKSQYIDSSGKCRIIYIRYNRMEVSLLCDPIPPMNIPVEDSINIMAIDKKYALDLAEDMRMRVLNEKEATLEVKCISGNVLISIPIVYNQNVQVNKEGTIYSLKPYSQISEYTFNKKLARYLTEYTFWLFSRYLNGNKIDVVSDKVIKKFIDETMEVSLDFYNQLYVEGGDKYIQKAFNTTSRLMYNNKLMVPSEETVLRLAYVIKLGLVRDKQKVFEYYQHKEISSYYTDISDFDKHPYENILYGRNSVIDWIKEKFAIKQKGLIYSSIILDSQEPYYFSNPLIEGGKMFLAQNASNFETVYTIIDSWYKYGYNSVDQINPEAPEIEFIMYSYVNEYHIQPYKVIGSSSGIVVGVLGYKYISNDEEKVGFTVLLENTNDFESEIIKKRHITISEDSPERIIIPRPKTLFANPIY